MTLDDLLTGYLGRGGSLTGEPLRDSAREIWGLLLSETRKRVLDVPADSRQGELVGQCFDALVETAANEDAGTGALRSETLGQWSRTYRDTGKTRDDTLRTILRQYLGETGLLYRGWPE